MVNIETKLTKEIKLTEEQKEEFNRLSFRRSAAGLAGDAEKVQCLDSQIDSWFIHLHQRKEIKWLWPHSCYAQSSNKH